MRVKDENTDSGGTVALPGLTGRSAFRTRLRRLDIKASPYLYITPFFVLFGVFGLFPLLYTGWVSLTSRELLGGGHYVGLDNFHKLLFHDPYFWNAVKNTLAIGAISAVPQLLLALVLAHVLNTKMRVRTFFRMSLILPQVTSLVAVALIFKQLFSYNFGLFNYALGLIGIHRIYWEAGTYTSWIAISVMIMWRWTGYNALIYLAAMQGIPDDLYEAAAIDGARPWRQFVHVTIPMLRPTIIFTVILSTIGSLQLFTEPYLFQPNIQSGSTGGSARQYETIVMYMYEKSFGSTQYKLGYAAAIGWCLFMLIVIIGLINFMLARRIRSAE